MWRYSEIEKIIDFIVKEMVKLHICYSSPVLIYEGAIFKECRHLWSNNKAKQLYESYGAQLRYFKNELLKYRIEDYDRSKKRSEDISQESILA